MEELLHGVFDAAQSLVEQGQVSGDKFRVVRVFPQGLDTVEKPAQRIIHLVGNARSQQAEGRHLFILEGKFFGLVQCFPGGVQAAAEIIKGVADSIDFILDLFVFRGWDRLVRIPCHGGCQSGQRS